MIFECSTLFLASFSKTKEAPAPTGRRPVATDLQFGMSLPAENRHLALATTGVTEHSSEPRRLGLSVVDKLAVTAFATGDQAALLEQVRARAEVLVGPDADGGRRRIIAKRLATTEGHVELLEGLVGQALAQRDFEAVEILDRLLRSYSSRLVFLRREHADEMQRGRLRTVLVSIESV